jgi:hypothetical protein
MSFAQRASKACKWCIEQSFSRSADSARERPSHPFATFAGVNTIRNRPLCVTKNCPHLQLVVSVERWFRRALPTPGGMAPRSGPIRPRFFVWRGADGCHHGWSTRGCGKHCGRATGSANTMPATLRFDVLSTALVSYRRLTSWKDGCATCGSGSSIRARRRFSSCGFDGASRLRSPFETRTTSSNTLSPFPIQQNRERSRICFGPINGCALKPKPASFPRQEVCEFQRHLAPIRARTVS